MVQGSHHTFEVSKKAMVMLPILAFSNLNIPFEIETYASGIRLGVVLLQNK